MSLLGEATYALIRGGISSIGNLIPDITIEEQHRDEVVITRHPVEGGAVITDHAYALPAELEIKCGYSNSTGGSEGYVQEQYAAFRRLQQARKPFTVYTDKRKYENMLIRGFATVTDEKNKNILIATVSLQQLLIVSTQTTGNAAAGQSGTGSNTTKPSTDTTKQADASATADIANRGTQAGIGTGSQSFAGAFNPGGTPTASPGIGSTSFGEVGAAVSGLSAPSSLDDGVATFSDPATGEVLAEGAGQTVFGNASPGFEPYNPFKAQRPQ